MQDEDIELKPREENIVLKKLASIFATFMFILIATAVALAALAGFVKFCQLLTGWVFPDAVG